MEISPQEYGELVRERLRARLPEAQRTHLDSVTAEELAKMRYVLNLQAPFRNPDDTRAQLEATARTDDEKRIVRALTNDQIKALASAGAYSFETAARREGETQFSREKRAFALDVGITTGVAGLGVLAGAGAFPSAVTGATIGTSLAALYGLGRLEEKIWKQNPAGFLRTLGRGAFAPFGIPAGILKYGWNSLRKTGKDNYAAAKSIAIGEGALGHVADPFRWGWQIASGTVKGFRPSSWNNLKGLEKVTSIPGKAILKTANFFFGSSSRS